MKHNTQHKSKLFLIKNNSQCMFDNIPEELKTLNQWVVWKKEERAGRMTKVPYNPSDPRTRASVADSSTWGTFQQACQAARGNKVYGIGFVFTRNDPYVGVDLDKCRDPQTGEVQEKPKEIINQLDSYTEISQSGTGIHIILRGDLPPGGRRQVGTEMYKSNQYFCMTGNHLEGTPKTIEERETQLKELHAQTFSQKKDVKEDMAQPATQGRFSLSDEGIIKKAKEAKNGQAFEQLWQGKWEGNYPSQSEGDLALCAHLAFWTGRNPEQLDRLFRQSKMFRPKWDMVHYSGGITYGQGLIAKVMKEQKEIYEPREQTFDTSDSYQKKIIPAELAERFLEVSGLKSPEGLGLRWHREEWFKFNGQIYQPVVRPDLRAEVMAYLQGNAFRKYAGPELVKNILANLEGMCLIPSSVELPAQRSNGSGEWETCRQKIVFQNGILDYDLWVALPPHEALLPHDSALVSKVLLPYAFDYTATCPRWLTFLEEILPDPESRQLLQDIFGYCLTHDTSLQKFFLFEGAGGNGKGVIINILTEMVGEKNVSSIPLELFGAPHGLETTLGKLVNITSEIGEMDRVAEGFLKQFTGEDRMHFNPKYKVPFTAKPTAKLILATNLRPPFRDRSEGLWRRLIVLPFPVIIPENQRNSELTKALLQELPGIFNWALEGHERLWERGSFLEPASCKVLREDYRREANPARIFLEEYVEDDPEASVQTDLLYRSYTQFCEKHGNRKLNDSNFGREVKGYFPGVERKRISIPTDGTRYYYYQGLRLVGEKDHDIDDSLANYPF